MPLYLSSSVTWGGSQLLALSDDGIRDFFLCAFTYFLRSSFRIRKIVFKNKSDDKRKHPGKDTECPLQQEAFLFMFRFTSAL